MKRTIREQLLDEIAHVMRVKDVSQRDFAEHKGVSPQSVNQIFTGRRGLLTSSGIELFEYLGVRLRLEIISEKS
jgi:transcriptional regulator with XRE-family HTH domain